MGGSLGWGSEKNHGEQGNARGSADNNNEYNEMTMMLRCHCRNGVVNER
jgi:hypothetical protein